mmetsp:Transcript_29941/g.53141  ORF Transcript_29941/g.53141 Transcript_29941/m.53141 type:complete len:248 (-) Transcript_29941:201-944(-)
MDEYILDFNEDHFKLLKTFSTASLSDDYALLNVNCKLKDFERVLNLLMETDFELSLGMFKHDLNLQSPSKLNCLLPPNSGAETTEEPLCPSVENNELAEAFDKIVSKLLLADGQMQEGPLESVHHEPLPDSESPANSEENSNELPSVSEPSASSYEDQDAETDGLGELVQLVHEAVASLGLDLQEESEFDGEKYWYKASLEGRCVDYSDVTLNKAKEKTYFVALFQTNLQAALDWDCRYKQKRTLQT